VIEIVEGGFRVAHPSTALGMTVSTSRTVI